MVTPRCRSDRSIADIRRTGLASLTPLALTLVCGTLLLGCDSTRPRAVPTLVEITPSTGARTTTVRVALTGTNFSERESTISVSGAGVAVEALAFGSATLLEANFVIAADAAAGDREVTVSTPGGTSAARTFSILLAPPTIAAVTPSAGARGSTAEVTITGTNFVPGETTVAVTGSGVAVGAVAVASSTTLTADLVIDAGAEKAAK